MAALAVLASFPPLAKGLSAAIVVTSFLQLAIPGLTTGLGLVAARAIPRPWTLLTCAFLHDNVITALAYAVGLLFLGRIVEPLYGARELARFLLAAIAAASFCTVGVTTFCYYAVLSAEKSSPEADHAGDVLFRPMVGFEAGLAALLVAVKQLIPDNEVALLNGALTFRAKHLPALFAAVMVGGSVLLGGALRVIPFTLFGTYAAWAYLRFLQSRDGVRGDLSEEFRLASFFPQPLQPPVDAVAGACTRLTGLGAGGNGSASGQQQSANYNYGMGGGALPGTDAGDAARRRERGVKALEERLGLKKSTSTNSTGNVAAAATAASEQPAAAAAAAAQQAAAAAAAAGDDVEAALEA